MTSVGIIGAGAWGTALGMAVARAGCSVLFWDHDPTVVDRIIQSGSTDRPLKDLTLSPKIQGTHTLEDLCACPVIFMVTAAQAVRSVAQSLAPFLAKPTPIKKDVSVILCSKGLEAESGELLTQVVRASLPKISLGVLSGPAFAQEVALGLPTAVTLAAESLEKAHSLCQALSHETFIMEACDDVVGVQLGGAFKNVLALASGMARGLKWGENFQAALIAYGLKELQHLGGALGAHPQTFTGLSGLGDIILTCTSLTSRNMAVGSLLGTGKTLEDIKISYPKLAEGVETARALKIIAQKHALTLPLCQAVYEVLYERISPAQALKKTLSGFL